MCVLHEKKIQSIPLLCVEISKMYEMFKCFREFNSPVPFCLFSMGCAIDVVNPILGCDRVDVTLCDACWHLYLLYDQAKDLQFKHNFDFNSIVFIFTVNISIQKCVQIVDITVHAATSQSFTG